MRTIKEALEDGSLSLEDEIDYDDTPQAEEIALLKLEIERLNNIINEFKDWLERKKQFYDTDEEEAIDYYFLYGDVLNEFKGLLGELKGDDKE